MGDELREYLEGVREGWRDPYWWADHALLQTVVLCVAAGSISLTFKYLELRLTTKMGSVS